MRRFIESKLIIGITLLGSLALTANAQWRNDPYDRNGRYDRNDPYYGNRGGSGYGSNVHSMVSRVLSDVQFVARRSRVDGHERQHFQNVQRELVRFQDRLRQGRYDDDRLDEAIDNLRDLARADQIHPSDRGRLAQDLRILQQIRANRGYMAGGYRPF